MHISLRKSKSIAHKYIKHAIQITRVPMGYLHIDHRWMLMANSEHWMTLNYCVQCTKNYYYYSNIYLSQYNWANANFTNTLNNAMYFDQPIPVAYIFLHSFLYVIKEPFFSAFYSWCFASHSFEWQKNSIHYINAMHTREWNVYTLRLLCWLFSLAWLGN